ncbi:MAG: hypothetical protein ACO1OX_04120 [Novosphingobium sp.]
MSRTARICGRKEERSAVMKTAHGSLAAFFLPLHGAAQILRRRYARAQHMPRQRPKRRPSSGERIAADKRGRIVEAHVHC